MIVLEVRGGHRNRLICIMGEDCKGAGGIETNAPDRVRIDVVLGQDSLKGYANGFPDIVGRLFLGLIRSIWREGARDDEEEIRDRT